MKYRWLGKTGLKISEVGFGVWSVSTVPRRSVDERESMALLHLALDLGITFFDTSDAYGDGYGEDVLARALGEHRHHTVIGTKFGYDLHPPAGSQVDTGLAQDFSPSFVRRACEQSLRRLKTDYIDLYQLHNPPLSAIQDDDLFETLETLIKEGKVRYYGAALGPDAGWLEEEGDAPLRRANLSSLQVSYSILEQDLARKLLPLAEVQGMGLLSRSPHALGILDGTYDRGTIPPLTDHPGPGGQEWLESSLRKVTRLAFLTRDTEATMGQIALKFCLALRPVASVLPDICRPEQLRELAAASETPDLDPQVLEHLTELYDHDFEVEETRE